MPVGYCKPPAVYLPMRFAVFFYADAAVTNDDAVWWQHLLLAMVQQGVQHEVLLFTNKPTVFTAVHNRILPQAYKQPTGVLVRRRTLNRWRQAAQKPKAVAVVCIGMQSFVVGVVPTYIFLSPNRPPKPKLLDAAKAKGAHFWVNDQAAKADLKNRGIANITVLPGGPQFAPVDNGFDASQFQEQHTAGQPYFLYAGPVAAAPNIIGLLKAFSRFKHRQKSSWKLVLLPLGGDAAGVDDLQKMLVSYKYRHDVVLPQWAEGQTGAAAYFAAAYAFVQPTPVQRYGHYLHDAIATALPIIATNEPQHKAIAGNAALYYEDGDEQLLATCLMQVYKDEALHGRLSVAAREAGGQTGWQQTSAAAWQSLGVAEK